MRTNDEMILAVHARAGEIRKRRNNLMTILAGTVSAAFSAVLLALLATRGGLQHRIMPSDYSGSSLLSDDVGGYVLVGVAAFMAGAALTVFIRRLRKKDGEKQG